MTSRQSLLALGLFSALMPWCGAIIAAQPTADLRFCIAAQPRTLDPLAATDSSSETLRFLTGGVLVRLNRQTQQLQPELATAWTIDSSGRSITFTLRAHVYFSDGTPFSAADVVYTLRRLMDPALHLPSGDAFRAGSGSVQTRIRLNQVTLTFPAPIAGLNRLFDQVPILSSRSPLHEQAVLGPYYLSENKAGSYLLLRRNPNYWKHDSSGTQLPYLRSIRLDIQQNRDIEFLRFQRGEIDFIENLNPDNYDRLRTSAPSSAVDAGVSLDSEQMWFNQVPSAPMPEYKRAWFASTAFRRALSEAINRGDLARIVYRGHARPAVSWVSPANRFWFNQDLRPHPSDPASALRRLAAAGFSLTGSTLRDRSGHPVEFSVITNAGNKDRERMAAMIQQDLARIGIRLNVVTLDFSSLIERITRTFDYEACLLGLVNDELDPDAQMNVWLSSADNHQWNPHQPSPATPWEAEVDRLMRRQAATMNPSERKRLIDRVQQIVWEQEPFLYLVNKDALLAVSPRLRNTHPVPLRPQVYWNIEQLQLASPGRP